MSHIPYHLYLNKLVLTKIRKGTIKSVKCNIGNNVDYSKNVWTGNYPVITQNSIPTSYYIAFFWSVLLLHNTTDGIKLKCYITSSQLIWLTCMSRLQLRHRLQRHVLPIDVTSFIRTYIYAYASHTHHTHITETRGEFVETSLTQG